MLAQKSQQIKINKFIFCLLLLKGNHLSRAPVESGVSIGYKPVGVLKRDSKPNGQPVYLTVSGWSFGHISSYAQPLSSAYFAASGLLTFAAGCFFWLDK